MIVESTEFINDRQKVELSVVKKDTENDNVLAGAEFGLYAKEHIKAGDQVIVKADTLLSSAVTGKDGKVVFEQDLPFGKYYVKDLTTGVELEWATLTVLDEDPERNKNVGWIFIAWTGVEYNKMFDGDKA